MQLTPFKFAVITLNTVGTLPLKLPSESVYEAFKKTSFTFHVAYVFVKYISSSLILAS